LLIACGLVAGCTAAGPPVFATASEAEDARRRPDGVAIDLTSEPPAAQNRASTEHALVTLRTPLGIDLAIGTVKDLFRTIVTEDSDGMAVLFAKGAKMFTAGRSGSQGQTLEAQDYWNQRFRRFDYTKLAGEPLFREAEVETYRAGDSEESPLRSLYGTGSAGKGAAAMPAGVRSEGLDEEDVIIRIPIATSRAGLDKLLGDEMVVFVRREGDRYKIYRILEDFQPQ
jgi:hypothetical protein